MNMKFSSKWKISTDQQQQQSIHNRPLFKLTTTWIITTKPDPSKRFRSQKNQRSEITSSSPTNKLVRISRVQRRRDNEDGFVKFSPIRNRTSRSVRSGEVCRFLSFMCPFELFFSSLRSIFVDLGFLAYVFKNILLDLRRREEDGPFEVKILEKKWKWVLRRGGASADHRVGGVFRPPPFFFSEELVLERSQTLSL